MGATGAIDGSTSSIDRVRRVYEADHARLWRSIYAFSGSADVADEATAEAFAQALRRGDEVRDVAAWVWRAAYAIAKGELQRRRQHAADGSIAATGHVEDTAPDHDVADLGSVLRALEELSSADREIVVLCHIGGWKPGELSAVLGESAGALRVRLHRASKRARALLAEQGGLR